MIWNIFTLRSNLFFELLDALRLDLVHQPAQNNSVLQNLCKVALRQLLIQNSFDPLECDMKFEFHLFNLYSVTRYLQDLLLLLWVPGSHLVVWKIILNTQYTGLPTRETQLWEESLFVVVRLSDIKRNYCSAVYMLHRLQAASNNC